MIINNSFLFITCLLNLFSLSFSISFNSSSLSSLSSQRNLRGKDSPSIKLQINTKQGKYLGKVDYDVRVWRGIKYGVAQRWKDAIPAPKFNEVKEQYEFGASCFQPSTGGLTMSEDCLFLNVYAPLDESKSKKGYPVYVFIHGGALVEGTSNYYEPQGITMALQNEIITVTINYRLNVFGYFKPSSIKNGHFGFRDQQLALKWVQQNIEQFGGDPNRVTLAGQSAGARSTLLHTLSPGSSGLFQQVIQLSTPMKDNFVSADSAAVLANALSAYVSCNNNDLNCLRGKTAETILEAAAFGYYPAHDDYFNMNYFWYGIVLNSEDFPFSSVFDALPAKNSVPTITGTTWNEGLALFLPIPTELKTDKAYYKKVLEYLSTGIKPEAQTSEIISTPAQQLYDVYPFERNYAFNSFYPNGYDGYDESVVDANYLLSMMYHDISYYCSIRRFNRARLSAAKRSSTSIYSFLFSHVATCSCSDFPSQCLYTTHSDDLPFIATPNLLTKCPGSASVDDISVSLRLRSGLVNFIHTGDPNKGPMASSIGSVEWPKYTLSGDSIIEIGTVNKRLDSFRSNICAFWDDRGYYHGFDIGDPFF